MTMKKSRLEKIILEELSKVPNVSIACERVGISRQTLYRWIKEDIKFKNKFEHAISLGNESINDLAESKLISNIKEGKQRSIEYWLNNNKRKYLRPREIDYLRNLMLQQKNNLMGNDIEDNNNKVVKWIVINGSKTNHTEDFESL